MRAAATRPTRRDSLRALMRALAAVMLLPLSLLPVMLVGLPRAVAEYEQFSRQFLHRAPLAATEATVTPAGARQLQGAAGLAHGVPVLAYTGVGDEGVPGGVSRAVFAYQMEALARARYTAVDLQQYDRFLRGGKDLPARPVLITVDGGQLQSWRAADAVLRNTGMRATLFVATREASGDNPRFLRWPELRNVDASDTWDVQLRSGAGARHVDVGDGSERGRPFYAWRALRSQPREVPRLETFAEYRQRVEADMVDALATARRELPGFRPRAFAAPFGDIGQRATNDERIAPWLAASLRNRFGTVMLAGREGSTRRFSRPTDARSSVMRLQVDDTVTTGRLVRWLRAGQRSQADQRAPTHQVCRSRQLHLDAGSASLLRREPWLANHLACSQ